MMKHLVAASALSLAVAVMSVPAPASSANSKQAETGKPEKAPALPGKIWKKGEKYRGNGRAISNPGRYHLKTPPEGKRWVKDGSRFLLINLAEGTIDAIHQGR